MSVDPTSPDVLTEEDHQVIERGLRMAALVATPGFAEAINDLSNEIGNRLLSSDLHETDRREELFRLHKCLELITGIISQAISAKMEAERHAADLADQREQEEIIEE